MRSASAHFRRDRRGRHDRPTETKSLQKRKTPQAEPETNEKKWCHCEHSEAIRLPKNVQNRTGARVSGGHLSRRLKRRPSRQARHGLPQSLRSFAMTVLFMYMRCRKQHFAERAGRCGHRPLRKTYRRRRVGNAYMRSASAHFRRDRRGGHDRPTGAKRPQKAKKTAGKT